MHQKLMIVAVVAAGALGGFLWITGSREMGASALLPAAVAQEATAPAEATPAEAKTVPDMALGSADAPLTVIEYASYTCPHCGNFHNRTFDQVKAEYIDNGKVRFIYREVYFDRFGLWAAMVARCGGEMKYFGIADLLFETQSDWVGSGQDAEVAENLRKIGLKAGITKEALDVCMNDGKMAEAMVAVFQRNAEADGIESTPTFIIGGDKHTGDMPFEEFSQLLDAKLGG
jgi:protein-disulfide isomerase